MFLHVTVLCWCASSRKLLTIGNAEITFVKEKKCEHAIRKEKATLDAGLARVYRCMSSNDQFFTCSKND